VFGGDQHAAVAEFHSWVQGKLVRSTP